MHERCLFLKVRGASALQTSDGLPAVLSSCSAAARDSTTTATSFTVAIDQQESADPLPLFKADVRHISSDWAGFLFGRGSKRGRVMSFQSLLRSAWAKMGFFSTSSFL